MNSKFETFQIQSTVVLTKQCKGKTSFAISCPNTQNPVCDIGQIASLCLFFMFHACIYLFFSSVVPEAVWSVRMGQKLAVNLYQLSTANYKQEIADMLEEQVNLDGMPKLFVVSCNFGCQTEILRQVGNEKRPFLLVIQ